MSHKVIKFAIVFYWHLDYALAYINQMTRCVSSRYVGLYCTYRVDCSVNRHLQAHILLIIDRPID